MKTVLKTKKQITAEVLRDTRKVRELKNEWDALLESAENNVFLTAELQSVYLEEFSKSWEPFVVVVREDKKIVLIAPFVIGRIKLNGWKVRAVQFIGQDVFTPLDLICEPGKEHYVSYVVTALKTHKPLWDIVRFTDIPGHSKVLLRLKENLSNRSIRFWEGYFGKAPFKRLSGTWTDVYNGLKRTTRKNLRRRQKRLEKEGELRFKRFRDGRGFEQALPEILEVEKKSWKGKRNIGIFSDEANIRFQQKVAEKASENGWLEISLLHFNGRPISYQYGFKVGDKFFAYNSSFDPEFKENSPGNLIIKFLMSELCCEGVREFDFLNGDQAYKYDWTDESRTLKQLMVFNDSLYGRLLYSWQSRIKPGLKKILRKGQTQS